MVFSARLCAAPKKDTLRRVFDPCCCAVWNQSKRGRCRPSPFRFTRKGVPLKFGKICNQNGAPGRNGCNHPFAKIATAGKDQERCETDCRGKPPFDPVPAIHSSRINRQEGAVITHAWGIALAASGATMNVDANLDSPRRMRCRVNRDRIRSIQGACYDSPYFRSDSWCQRRAHAESFRES